MKITINALTVYLSALVIFGMCYKLAESGDLDTNPSFVDCMHFSADTIFLRAHLDDEYLEGKKGDGVCGFTKLFRDLETLCGVVGIVAFIPWAVTHWPAPTAMPPRRRY